MTKLLDEALVAVRGLPPETQDAVAKMMILAIADDDEPEDIPVEHLDAVLEGLAQADRGEFVDDAHVADLWRRFDR